MCISGILFAKYMKLKGSAKSKTVTFLWFQASSGKKFYQITEDASESLAPDFRSDKTSYKTGTFCIMAWLHSGNTPCIARVYKGFNAECTHQTMPYQELLTARVSL